MVQLRSLGAFLVLIVAGSILLGFGARQNPRDNQSLAMASDSPIPSFERNSTPAKLDAKGVLDRLPLIFEPNQGQADASVKFLARGAGYGLFLDEAGAVLAVQAVPKSGNAPEQQFIRMTLVGANPAAITRGTDPLPGRSNYFIGNDPHQWRRGIPQFADVRYQSVYPGIDLVFYGNQGRLEYDFRVAPGSDPAQAELQFDGASKLQLKGGDLLVAGKNTEGAVVRLQAPKIYQVKGDQRREIEGRFVLRAADRVAFEIGPYDHCRELVIDPVLQFSTYFGGSGSETSPSVAVNGDGNIYLAGSTQGSPASSFPTTTTPALFPSTLSLSSTSPSHIFVAKISPSQPPAVLDLTFIGGSGSDTSVGLGVDAAGNTFVVGNTSSSDFPTTTSAYQTKPAKTVCAISTTCTSVFVSELSFPTTGTSLTYSSYLSGNGDDVASGMAIDTQQDVFVTGTTTSNNAAGNGVAFPASELPVPFQSAALASVQFFVTKINTKNISVAGIAYSTYFGGSTPASPVATGGGITVDSTGNIYFSGTTNFYNSGSGLYGNSGSGDFPILNAYQPCLDTTPPTTLTNPFPCSAPGTTPYPTDAFVAKLNPTAQAGSQLLFSTYLGGSVSDSSTSIAIDSGAANIYVTGSTNSPDFVLPTGTQAFQTCLDTPPVTPPVTTCTVTSTATAPAPFDAYVARLSNPAVSTTGTPNEVTLTYFSYLGGSGNDSAAAIAVDTAGDALVTGATSSTNFPVTTGAIQSAPAAGNTQSAFFAHLVTTATTLNNQLGSFSTYFGGSGSDRGTSIAVDPSLNSYFAGDTTSATLFPLDNPLSGAGGSSLNGPSDAFVVKLGTATDLCISCVAPVISPTGIVSAGNAVTITYTLSNNGPDVAAGINVVGIVPAGVTFNSASAGSGTCSPPSTGSTSTGTSSVACQIPTLQVGSVSSIVFTVTPTTAGTYQAIASVSSANDTDTAHSTAPASFTASGFSLSISPSAQTAAAGTSAQYTVVVSPTAGVFGANVSLTCSALPTGAACHFTTSTLTLTGGAGSASTVLNVSTTAQPVSTASSTWQRPFYAFWLIVPGLALFGLGAGGKRHRRWLGLTGLTLLCALVLLLPACHSSKTQPTVSGTPSGTYPLTVTATSGSLTQSAPFSLTVIP